MIHFFYVLNNFHQCQKFIDFINQIQSKIVLHYLFYILLFIKQMQRQVTMNMEYFISQSIIFYVQNRIMVLQN
ncbi:unnamed protein product (macronuclear) [Paramecium tetraurelia]|uniref:Transmembrane protein n=1 Tax=Paramecium tetraurelia TaxID=5888 RepID=A0BDR3_PARTE|nr:uncharacterized protein GSPATT00027710001 [Paramecium tetraurelia]CAK56680.1 unnamed protein product [Paramecium tetraurelia]|eukprot:XP_001424078.1 hypothetical protein (macronuclear) [Paramecium tetraurelia strain d4-2]